MQSREKWLEFSFCKGKDPTSTIFYPPDAHTNFNAYDQAKEMCAQCSVVEECWFYTKDDEQDYFGFRAGMTVEARRIRRGIEKGRPVAPIQHGTTLGYAAESRRGLVHCEACARAKLRQDQERKAGRRS